MRVCYLADAGSVHVQRWAEHFVGEGYSVHLISLRPFRSNVENVNLSNLHLHLVKWPVPYTKKVPYVGNLLSVFVNVKMFISKIRKIKPDILHAHSVTGYALIGALTNFHPFIISVWGSDVLSAPKKSRISKYKVSYVLKRADCVTTTAKFMKGCLVKTFGLSQNKILTIPWGIDLKLFHRGYEKEARTLKRALRIKADAPVVLSNRHMVPVYEIESIIDVIPYVLKSHPDATFIFIRGYGSPEFENKMKLKARKLGIIKNTRFIPRLVTPKTMAIYFNMSDASISIPKYGQFGASILEGMSCGSIPVVSDIPVHREVLMNGENAFLVNPDNPKQIAETIIHFIEHPEIKQQFYKRNKNIIAQRWNWNKNARKMEETYEKLAKGW